MGERAGWQLAMTGYWAEKDLLVHLRYRDRKYGRPRGVGSHDWHYRRKLDRTRDILQRLRLALQAAGEE